MGGKKCSVCIFVLYVAGTTTECPLMGGVCLREVSVGGGSTVICKMKCSRALDFYIAYEEEYPLSIAL